MVGDSLLTGLGVQFVDWGDVFVKECGDVTIEQFLQQFTTNFVEAEWKGICGMVIAIGSEDVQDLEARVFHIKLRLLVKIVLARFGDIKVVLLGIPPRASDVEDIGKRRKVLNEVMCAVANELGISHPLYKAFFAHGQLKVHYFQEDGIQLAGVAIRLLAKVVKMYRARFFCQ